MSCVAMALSGYNLSLPGSQGPPTPGTLNEWLVSNGGYKCASGDCNNIVLEAVDTLSSGVMHIVGEWGGDCCGGNESKPSQSLMQEGLDPKRTAGHLVFIAHVRNSSHFVLVTAWDAERGQFAVLDPFYAATHYPYAAMSDVIIYSVFPPRAHVPKIYPLFKQADYRWGKDVIHTKTIAAVGCLMSSTAMALHGHGIRIAHGVPRPLRGLPITPGSFNSWCQGHGGLVGDDLEENAVPALDPEHIAWSEAGGMHRTNDLSVADVAARLAQGQPVIANVMGGRHFVLVVGTDKIAGSRNTTLFVHDPGFYRIAYDMQDVVGWRLFNMTQAAPTSSRDESN